MHSSSSDTTVVFDLLLLQEASIVGNLLTVRIVGATDNLTAEEIHTDVFEVSYESMGV